MTVNQVGSTATNYNVGMGASSSTTASTTATRGASSATSTSSARTVSSTTPASGSTASPSGVGKVSSTTPYSPAIAQTTSSTTVTYSGPESTAKVSSTTATTGTTASKATESTSTAGASASSTASTTAISNSSGTPTASVAATTTPTVGATSTNTGATSGTIEDSGKNDVSETDFEVVEECPSNTPQYAYLSHMGGEALQEVESALIELGYDYVQDGDFINSLEQFKEDVGLLAYSTYSYEVVGKLSEVYEEIDTIKDNLNELGFLSDQGTIARAFSDFKKLLDMDKYSGSILDVMENVEEIKTVLENTYFYDKDTETFKEALLQFDNIVGSNDNRTIEQINKISDCLEKNENFASQLMELGFFNPESGVIDPKSVQADSAPSNINKCIENFCRVYGVDYNADNMDNIMAKIDEVHTYYKKILNSEKTDSVLKALGANAESQKINFSKSWTFLKLGMGFSEELSSAVLANWYEEGAFSETNRENFGGNNAIDDSATYEYEIDGIGFGIMQWTCGSFKEQLQTIAGEMKSGVGNINTQFAMFKAVVSPESTEYGLWKQVIAGNSIEDYTKTFLFKMENPEVKDDAEIQHRINTAKTIYEGMV